MEKSEQEIAKSLRDFKHARVGYTNKLTELLEAEVGKVIYLVIQGIDCGGYDGYRVTIPGELKKSPAGNFLLSTIEFSGEHVDNATEYRGRLTIWTIHGIFDDSLEKTDKLNDFSIGYWGYHDD